MKSRTTEYGKERREQCFWLNQAGFSLLELIIAVTIIVILSGLSTYGVAMLRRRDVERYTRTLVEQIELTKQMSITTGKDVSLTLTKSDDAYSYEITGEGNEELCNTRDITITGIGSSAAAGNGVICEWQFDRNTGECLKGYVGDDENISMEGIEISGYNRYYEIRVYQENGYCEYTENRTKTQ